MKTIINIPKNKIPEKQEIKEIDLHFIDKQLVYIEGYEFWTIPDDATNGDMIMSMFPRVTMELNGPMVTVNMSDYITQTFTYEWWTAKYEGWF